MSENVQAFLPVLKNALIRRGLPARLYVDNGAAYRSRQLALVCAKLGVVLVHARPYQPAGKGYASHCTSRVRWRATSGFGNRFESLRPCCLVGGLPGISYRQQCLSL